MQIVKFTYTALLQEHHVNRWQNRLNTLSSDMSVDGWMQYLQVLQNHKYMMKQSQSSNTASTFEPPYRTSEKSHSMRTITKEINFIAV